MGKHDIHGHPGSWATPASFLSGSQWFASACLPYLWPRSINLRHKPETGILWYIYAASMCMSAGKRICRCMYFNLLDWKLFSFTWAHSIHCLTNSHCHFQLVHILTTLAPSDTVSASMLIIYYLMCIFVIHQKCNGTSLIVTVESVQDINTIQNAPKCMPTHSSFGLFVLIDGNQPSWPHRWYHVVQQVVTFAQNGVPALKLPQIKMTTKTKKMTWREVHMHCTQCCWAASSAAPNGPCLQVQWININNSVRQAACMYTRCRICIITRRPKLQKMWCDKFKIYKTLIRHGKTI